MKRGFKKDGNRVVNPASSAGETRQVQRILDMDEVAGSSPAPPTSVARSHAVVAFGTSPRWCLENEPATSRGMRGSVGSPRW